MAASLATLTGINALENLMDSEAGIVEAVLDSEFLIIAHLATLTGINALYIEMDSEGRIVEVVLGTEFQTMTGEQAMIKLGLKTGSGSSHEKSVQATIQFGILPVIFFIPFITL